jgi:hypothetical protein
MSVTFDPHGDPRDIALEARQIVAGLADEMVHGSDYEQMRYRQGLENGTAILMEEDVLKFNREET